MANRGGAPPSIWKGAGARKDESPGLEDLVEETEEPVMVRRLRERATHCPILGDRRHPAGPSWKRRLRQLQPAPRRPTNPPAPPCPQGRVTMKLPPFTRPSWERLVRPVVQPILPPRPSLRADDEVAALHTPVMEAAAAPTAARVPVSNQSFRPALASRPSLRVGRR